MNGGGIPVRISTSGGSIKLDYKYVIESKHKNQDVRLCLSNHNILMFGFDNETQWAHNTRKAE